MQVIGSLISLHPNELGAHRVNCAIKGLDIHLSELPSETLSFSFGYAHFQKPRLRPTTFSHIRDCDSAMAPELASKSERYVPSIDAPKPCACKPCPVSWSVPKSAGFRKSSW